MEAYKMPMEKKEACTCKGNARRDGRNISSAIATSAGYGRDIILKTIEEFAEKNCEGCQWRFVAGFFEEKQKREEHHNSRRRVNLNYERATCQV